MYVAVFVSICTNLSAHFAFPGITSDNPITINLEFTASWQVCVLEFVECMNVVQTFTQTILPHITN